MIKEVIASKNRIPNLSRMQCFFLRPFDSPYKNASYPACDIITYFEWWRGYDSLYISYLTYKCLGRLFHPYLLAVPLIALISPESNLS